MHFRMLCSTIVGVTLSLGAVKFLEDMTAGHPGHLFTAYLLNPSAIAEDPLFGAPVPGPLYGGATEAAEALLRSLSGMDHPPDPPGNMGVAVPHPDGYLGGSVVMLGLLNGDGLRGQTLLCVAACPGLG